MTEEKSTFDKLIEGSFLDKIVAIAAIITFIIILLGTEIHINPALYSISLTIFIILVLFITPLKAFTSKNEDELFGLEELVIFTFHGINIIVFCITLHIIFLSDNCQLNLTYWIFLLSGLLLIMFFVFTKFKKKKATVNHKKDSRVMKIANWIFTIISLLILLKNAAIPIIYTVTSEDYLKEIKRPREISVYTIDQQKDKKKYGSEIEIKDKELIDEIIEQINHNKAKSIKGFEALNHMKRSIKLPHYELAHFEYSKFDGFLYLKIFQDGNIFMKKSWFGSFWIKYYATYYEVELLPETVEKITSIIDTDEKKQD